MKLSEYIANVVGKSPGAYSRNNLIALLMEHSIGFKESMHAVLDAEDQKRIHLRPEGKVEKLDDKVRFLYFPSKNE